MLVGRREREWEVMTICQVFDKLHKLRPIGISVIGLIFMDFKGILFHINKLKPPQKNPQKSTKNSSLTVQNNP